MSGEPAYERGQQWGALRKAWKGYRIAKVQGDRQRMKEYAERIRSLCEKLGIDKPKFSSLGLE